MKKLIALFLLTYFTNVQSVLLAQETTSISKEMSSKNKKRNPIYDFSISELNNTDSIPDFDSKPEKMLITGTIYESDGVTPAKDVILYISQTDENGDYEMKRTNGYRYVYHRACIKTDADGKYVFYTFMPGKFDRSKDLKQIQRTIKAPGKAEYELNPFFFNDDPLIPSLTVSCRAQVLNNMLRLETKDGILVATKDIRLQPDNTVAFE